MPQYYFHVRKTFSKSPRGEGPRGLRFNVSLNPKAPIQSNRGFSAGCDQSNNMRCRPRRTPQVTGRLPVTLSGRPMPRRLHSPSCACHTRFVRLDTGQAGSRQIWALKRRWAIMLGLDLDLHGKNPLVPQGSNFNLTLQFVEQSDHFQFFGEMEDTVMVDAPKCP